jgi:hypothetical protein
VNHLTESARRTALLGRAEGVAGILPNAAGLSARAWERYAPISRAELALGDACPPREAANRAGLRGAGAIPALNGDEVLAVIDLHGRDDEIAQRLMPSPAGVGRTLGALPAGRREELGGLREAA